MYDNTDRSILTTIQTIFQKRIAQFFANLSVGLLEIGAHLVCRIIISSLLILQHIILAFKCSIAYAIPDIPYWVEQQMAKWEFGRREALKVCTSGWPKQPYGTWWRIKQTIRNLMAYYAKTGSTIYKFAVESSSFTFIRLAMLTCRSRYSWSGRPVPSGQVSLLTAAVELQCRIPRLNVSTTARFWYLLNFFSTSSLMAFFSKNWLSCFWRR